MKKMIMIALTLLTATSNVRAYDYSYKNATNKTLYFEPLAQGITEQFPFFKGERGANDGWGVKGPQPLNPGETQTYSFKGIWCHGGIKVGTSKNNMDSVTIFAAGKTDYQRILGNKNLTNEKANTLSSGKIKFAGIELLLNRHDMCGNVSYIIGENDNGTFFAIVTDF